MGSPEEDAEGPCGQWIGHGSENNFHSIMFCIGFRGPCKRRVLGPRPEGSLLVPRLDRAKYGNVVSCLGLHSPCLPEPVTSFLGWDRVALCRAVVKPERLVVKCLHGCPVCSSYSVFVPLEGGVGQQNLVILCPFLFPGHQPSWGSLLP